MCPLHRPYLTSGAALEIGLKPMLMPSGWLDMGPDHARFMDAKRARLRGCPPLYDHTLGTSRAAQAQLLRKVVGNLIKHHSAAFARDWIEERLAG